MKKFIIFIICLIFSANTSGQRSESSLEVLPKEDSYSERTSSGYNYFDSEGNLTGHSEEDAYGNYNYYDSSGNLIGSIEHEEEETYIIYNNRNIIIGELEKTPSKKYRYRSSFEGTLEEFDILPNTEEDIGSLPPFELFKGE